jgi:cytochrome d ubiquinol oxidase subunit II
MFIGYAVLDGFDLGVGALHMLVGRNEKDREMAINAIGPVWNGNEVWLLAGGGSMVVAFPHLYAAGFSGFYLALMLVLWLLILRGVGIEFRHQVDHPMWREIWDVVFSVASALLGVLFGVAVGNVLVGVPFNADGTFQGSFAVMLNPFAILAGVLSLMALSLHGATYLAMKTEGDLQERARKYAGALWWVVMALLLAITAASFVVRPDFMHNFLKAPVLFLLTAFGAASSITLLLSVKAKKDTRAFQASCGLIVSVLLSVAAGLFPMVLPSSRATQAAFKGLDIYNTASPANSQRTAFFIYLVGIAIVAVYLWQVYRTWSGKVHAGEGYHA